MNTFSLLIMVLLALAPGLEARFAMPYGILVAGFNPFFTLITVYLASTFPCIPILYVLGWAEEKIISRVGILDRIYRWSVYRVRGKVEKVRSSRYTYLALLLYVAIPLPLTGVWTGSLIAYLIGLDKPRSIASIALGNIIASLIVFLSVIGVIEIIYPRL